MPFIAMTAYLTRTIVARAVPFGLTPQVARLSENGIQGTMSR
jgi:hypothetical protein